jgi:hypothetical protein
LRPFLLWGTRASMGALNGSNPPLFPNVTN